MGFAYSDRLMQSKPTWPINARAGQGQGPDGSTPRARSQSIDLQLAELAALPHDWNEDGAPPISTLALRLARHLLALRPALAEIGEIHPSPEGGVLIEYVRNRWDLTVEISANGAMEIYGFQIDGTLKLYPVPYPPLGIELLEVLDGVGGPSWA